MAQAAGLQPGDFVHSFGDADLHLNHLEQARHQLTREPRPLPKLRVHHAACSRGGSTFRDIAIETHDPHPAIKAPFAV
jgi:thymidylate synthase